ncbi:translation initiation factor IF-3-like [Diadema antillarum]|uniref:translation initiation factor IF-3-like n=1 Tax=Diadema antillarum TaxID=105358 RepID=UPI003A8AB917
MACLQKLRTLVQRLSVLNQQFGRSSNCMLGTVMKDSGRYSVRFGSTIGKRNSPCVCYGSNRITRITSSLLSPKTPQPCGIIRTFSRYQRLHGAEETTEADLDYIEKELVAKNKLSRKQKRAAADLRNSMVNVGKMVPHKLVELMDENGDRLGKLNRSQAVALSQERKLKLVLLNPNAKPLPLYKLMSGQELHQEQLKRNEKVKKSAAPTQLKEIKASWNIGQHDVAVRRRQLENWFSDESSNIHVRVSVSGGRGSDIVPDGKQMDVVKQLMEGMEDRLTLNGPPQMKGKNQRTLMVTIRCMSAKEKAAYKKTSAGKS